MVRGLVAILFLTIGVTLAIQGFMINHNIEDDTKRVAECYERVIETQSGTIYDAFTLCK